MELNDTMRDCLIEANNEYPDYDYVDTVVQAFRQYVSIVGAPVEFESDDEGEEYFKKCVFFLVDCVIWSLIEKGVCEFDGLEDGEFVYKVTAEF